MRGKASAEQLHSWTGWITPAYAGKSRCAYKRARSVRDHPRVCGEKPVAMHTRITSAGSPPRMRGKVPLPLLPLPGLGITPAYAGKSASFDTFHPHLQDHPRVCGEKLQSTSASPRALGSPPRMRGKGGRYSLRALLNRITPAYAGKREVFGYQEAWAEDHPRVCGEKYFTIRDKVAKKGSPPRMRGKACIA